MEEKIKEILRKRLVIENKGIGEDLAAQEICDLFRVSNKGVSPPKSEPSKTAEEILKKYKFKFLSGVGEHNLLECMEEYASQFKQVPSEKRVTDEEIERIAEEYSPYNKYANPIDHELTTKPFIDGFKKALSLPSEGKEIDSNT